MEDADFLGLFDGEEEEALVFAIWFHVVARALLEAAAVAQM